MSCPEYSHATPLDCIFLVGLIQFFGEYLITSVYPPYPISTQINFNRLFPNPIIYLEDMISIITSKATGIDGSATVQELSATLARSGNWVLRLLHLVCADIAWGEAGFSALISVDHAAFGWYRVNCRAAGKQTMSQCRTAIIYQRTKHRVA